MNLAIRGLRQLHIAIDDIHIPSTFSFGYPSIFYIYEELTACHHIIGVFLHFILLRGVWGIVWVGGIRGMSGVLGVLT
jgi:hypothetical protein